MAAGFVIVGAGECGVRAAFALREAGFEGPLTLIGDEPHLPYERPPLSKGSIDPPKPIRQAEAYGDAGITLLRGTRAERIDRERHTVALSGGDDIAYDALLLTTGCRARLFPAIAGARTLRTLDDARALMDGIAAGRHMAIVGGGFIGLELAATARALGAVVTVIEAAGRLMARAVPEAVAAVAEARHREAGVDIRLDAPVESADAHRVTLADGTAIEADTVIAGVGSAPVTDLAEEAGLEVDNGIRVDGRFATADPRIFAAGDCCTFPYRGRPVRLESWQAAQQQGAHAARAMLGAAEAFAAVPWFWSDQHDLTLQVAGLAEPDLPHVRRDLDECAFVLFQLDGDGALVSVSGIGRDNAIAKDVRLGQMMMERAIKPDPAALRDPGTNLKALLKR